MRINSNVYLNGLYIHVYAYVEYVYVCVFVFTYKDIHMHIHVCTYMYTEALEFQRFFSVTAKQNQYFVAPVSN